MVNDALKKLKKKATEEEIQTAYFVLSSGLKSQLGSDEKSTSVAYFYALDGVSSWVLQTATKDALKGKAEGLNTTFMPSTADFYHYCEKLENRIRTRASCILKNLQKPELESKERGKRITSDHLEAFQQELRKVFETAK
ncbi:hypothetical protein [Bartonella bovis]|uniref:Uncharacterized protein n=1 Tax=Bartonella bovis 91-4 TaxID=1094491 RepID=N6VDU6_9HYPH|nr:hypothetical protein [Bartonella bovis]ENN91945.1 hypothetical protein BBbe_02450 [Bartonella bovis 91-4]